MEFKSYFYKSNTLEESLNALDQISQMHNLKEFLAQQNSPYILLQILSIALINLPEMPSNTIEELNADPKILVGDVVRKKMNYLMTKTRFSNDFNTTFRTVFPESTANPIEWSKKNREQAVNLESPEIKKIIGTIIQKYSQPTN